MLRILLVVAFVIASRTDSEACSCVQRTFAEHAKAAKQVLVVRAGKPVKTGDALKQTFTVLATLKGPVQAQFLWDRPATPPCAASYADGEFAILFTSGGDLDPCHGNLPIGAQAVELAAILGATGFAREAIKPDTLEAALRHTLTKYLHGRPQVAIGYALLDGKTFDIDKSKLTYSKSGKDIVIDNAHTGGKLSFVDGRYKTEGVHFTVVLVGTTVIHASVAER